MTIILLVTKIYRYMYVSTQLASIWRKDIERSPLAQKLTEQCNSATL